VVPALTGFEGLKLVATLAQIGCAALAVLALTSTKAHNMLAVAARTAIVEIFFAALRITVSSFGLSLKSLEPRTLKASLPSFK
jgi:hypothetical protein